MAGKTTSLTQRPRLLLAKNGQGNKVRKFGEMAGGTTAECAALCCCCPCAVMNLLVMAVYKVPAGLCKKAWRNRHRVARRKQVGGLLLGPTTGGGPTAEEKVAQRELLVSAAAAELVEENDEAAELEKEMWDRFNGAGFWRSPSLKDNETTPSSA